MLLTVPSLSGASAGLVLLEARSWSSTPETPCSRIVRTNVASAGTGSWISSHAKVRLGLPPQLADQGGNHRSRPFCELRKSTTPAFCDGEAAT